MFPLFSHGRKTVFVHETICTMIRLLFGGKISLASTSCYEALFTVRKSWVSLPDYGLMVHFRGSWPGRLFWLVLTSFTSQKLGGYRSRKFLDLRDRTKPCASLRGFSTDSGTYGSHSQGHSVKPWS